MSGHVRDVRAYVDRALTPQARYAADRHLVCCGTCRAAVDQERDLVAALRTAEHQVPGNLRQSLLELELGSQLAAFVGERSRDDAPAPAAWAGFTRPDTRVATVRPGAPPQHISARRAAVLASLAAGASAAAAWALVAAPATTAATPLPGGRVQAEAAALFAVADPGAPAVAPGAPGSLLGDAAPSSAANVAARGIPVSAADAVGLTVLAVRSVSAAWLANTSLTGSPEPTPEGLPSSSGSTASQVSWRELRLNP